MAQADIKVGVDISDITKAVAATKKWASANRTAFDVVNSRMKVFGETSSVAFNRFGDAALEAQKKSSQMGVVTQQLGYQVSDFIVQVQSGTSAFVAFGQQASQLVGILPLMSSSLGISAGKLIAVSAALGIAIPLFTAVAMAVQAAGKAAGDATNTTIRYKDALSAGKSSIKQLSVELYRLKNGIEDATEAQLKMGIESAKLAQKQNDLWNESNRLKSFFYEMGGGFTVLGYEISASDEKRIANLEEMLRLYKEQREEAKGIKEDQDAEDERVKREEEIQEILNKARKKQGQLIADEHAAMQKRMKEVTLENAKRVMEQAKADHETRMSYIEREADAQMRMGATPIFINQDSISKAAKIYKDRKAQEERDRKEKERLDKAAARAAARTAEAAKRKKEREEEIRDRKRLADAIRKQDEETQKLKDTADQLTAPFDDFFMALVDGTTTAKDAFRSMASDIIQQLYRILIVEQMVQSISGAIQGYMAGPVQGPNLPVESLDGGGYTGSGQRSGGLDGKGGFMAMLHPRETVIDHTKGQSAGGTVVNQVFNISANTSDDTKRLITQTIAQASPDIINQSVGAVMNQRRRGGAMKSAFG